MSTKPVDDPTQGFALHLPTHGGALVTSATKLRPPTPDRHLATVFRKRMPAYAIPAAPRVAQ